MNKRHCVGCGKQAEASYEGVPVCGGCTGTYAAISQASRRLTVREYVELMDDPQMAEAMRIHDAIEAALPEMGEAGE